MSYLSTNNKNWLHGVSVYCTVSVRDWSLWAKTQDIHECVCAPLVHALYARDVCVVCVSTHAIGLLWSTCERQSKRTSSGNEKRSMSREGWGLESHQRCHELADPRKLGAYHVAHTHTDMYMLVQTSLSLRPCLIFSFTFAASLLWIQLTFKLLGLITTTMDKSFLYEYETMECVAHLVLTDVHTVWLRLLKQEVLFDESRKWTPGDWAFCFNGTFFH